MASFASFIIQYYCFLNVTIIFATFSFSSGRGVCALSINLGSSRCCSRSGGIAGDGWIRYTRNNNDNNNKLFAQHRYFYSSWRKSTTKLVGGIKIYTVPPHGNDDDHISDDGRGNNNHNNQDSVTTPYTPILPPLSKDVDSPSMMFPTSEDFSSPKQKQQQQQQQQKQGTRKTNSSLLPVAKETTPDGTNIDHNNNSNNKTMTIVPSTSSQIIDDHHKNNLTSKNNPLSLFSESLSASLAYLLPEDETKRPEGTKASSTLYSSSSILDGVLPVSELFYRSTQSLVVDDSTTSATATTTTTTTSYTTSDNQIEDSGNFPDGGANVGTKNHRRSTLVVLPSSETTTNSRFGDDEELPFSAEQSDRLTTKGVNKINVRRNKADTFTTPFASSSEDTSTTSSTNTHDIIELGTRKHKNTSGHARRSSSSTSTNTANTTTTTTTTSSSTTTTTTTITTSRGGTIKKTTSYANNARSTSRYLNNGNSNPKYHSNTSYPPTNKNASSTTSTTTITTSASFSTNITRVGSSSSAPTRRSGNQTNHTKQRNVSTSSGKIIRRGMEMLVGGEPINADPPLKSIEIRYDASSFVAPDWTQVITTTSRDFGPLLHHSSAELVSEVSKGLFCEYFVNSAIKWKVCPQEFSDLVHEYGNATLLEYNATLGKKKSVTSRGGASMFYQDLLGRLTMEEKEAKFGQRTHTTNGLPVGKDDNNQNQKEVENSQRPTSSSDHSATTVSTQDDVSNKTNDVSAASELLRNFPIFNSRRGFGKAHSPLLRGGEKKNRVNTQTKQRVEFCLGFHSNISRHDLSRGSDEDTYDGTVLKRILSRGISKAIRAEELGCLVQVNQLFFLPVENGNTNVTLVFDVLPDHLRRFKNVQRDMVKLESLFSQDEDTQYDIAIGIASVVHEETAWPPQLRHKFVEEIFAPLKYDMNDVNNITFSEFFERYSFWRNDYILKFELGVNKGELQSVENGGDTVLRRAISNGIQRALRSNNVNVFLTRLNLREVESGVTDVTVSLRLAVLKNSCSPLQNEFSKINHALSEAVDSGDMCRSIAAAVQEETAWPAHLCKTIANELLVEAGDESILEEDEDGSAAIPEQLDTVTEEVIDDTSSQDVSVAPQKVDGPFVPNSFDFDPEDLYLSGGNDGVFFDYSEQNVGRAPFQGKLGPLLMDAATERARQRQPKVIAIGDVHGCIDELQALLRRCCFQPGDLVVFLGDLVSKGPDSLSVVQMAREIGSFGVRGNHDFEVIRWHQAIMSGADPPMIGSEHFQIASCLSKADLKWLYSLPWYLSSKDLGALFVHAGFVPGIRLPKQNPRLMMNMRSILPDGTVTSKFFSNWAWSRLWDGPQTVLFGHDADRGLQQYEHALGLDTGCVYGGRLTACILPEKRLVSVSAKREYFQYRRKQF